jgi:uncharacterized membrane protein
VSHPRAIEVTASDGRVTLCGPVLAAEEQRLKRTVSRIPGVEEIDDRLQIHEHADDLPSLQGGRRREPRADIRQVRWSPTTRLLSGIGGALLGSYGAQRRDLRGVGLSALGFVALARAATNLETKRLTGVGAGHRAVDVQKTVRVEAPVERVFALWSDYTNFPRFMSNVENVQDLGDGRSRWSVAGPAGVPVEWNATVTDYVPNQVLAWKTEPGSPVAHAGSVRFEPAAEATRVHVRLSYNPPAGALGHAVAKMLGADPKAKMDADLMRMKSFIESGTPPADAARPA